MSAVVAPGTVDPPPAADRAPDTTGLAPRRWPWRTALAAVGGVALFLAFPGYDLTAAAVVGPAALAVAVRGQRFRGGLWLGLVLGGCFLVPLLSWTGTYVGALPWLALAVWQATYYGLLGGALALTSRLPAWPVWGAALWVTDEALRGRWFLGGFPWGRLGFSQAEGPFTALAAYGGVPLVSFAVALTGTLLAAVALAGVHRARRSVAVLAAVAVAVPVVGWLAGLPLAGTSLTGGGPTATVAVVQGNVPRAGLDFNAQRRAVLDNHVEQTIALADDVLAGERPQPDVVIWPENSSDIDPLQNADATRAISRAAASIGAPILVGAVAEGPGRFLSNVAIVWDPVTGPGETYVKRHPVPFGEYMPARSFLRFFSDKVDLLRRDFAAGDDVGALDLAGRRVGVVICFEVAYDHLMSDVMAAGAGMLVVQTNNATFGYTDESEQQLAMGRLRAVEYGRTLVVAATSGISAIVAPDGSLARTSELYTADVFVEEIAQRDRATVAERLGAGPEWAIVALGSGALLFALGRRRAAGRAPR